MPETLTAKGSIELPEVIGTKQSSADATASSQSQSVRQRSVVTSLNDSYPGKAYWVTMGLVRFGCVEWGTDFKLKVGRLFNGSLLFGFFKLNILLHQIQTPPSTSDTQTIPPQTSTSPSSVTNLSTSSPSENDNGAPV